ncbi:MAG TPA: hypothetical protein VFZ89_05040 [Solirubrobacteraceae bacterium]
MKGREIDVTSLAGGVVLIILGVLILLDRTGEIDLTFAALWPLLVGAVGAVLLAAGLDDRRHGR